MAHPSPWIVVGGSNAAEVASGPLTLVTTGVTIATGDLVVACISARDSAAFSAPDSNWQLVEQQSSGNVSTTTSTSIASGAMFVCQSWPATPPSLVFGRTGGDVARGVLLVYRGQKASGALNAHSSATLGANSTTVTAPSITTTTQEELIVAMVAGADNSTVSAFQAAIDPTSPSGATDTSDLNAEQVWIERHDSNTATGADTSITVADAVKDVAGATGQIQATHALSSRHVMIVASFKNAGSDRSKEEVTKLSRYDVMGPATGKVSATKLSRYDILMAVGTVSVTKLSRYDILVPGDTPPPATKKRRVQNINYY